ncbi:acyl-CoA synthetase family protein [Aporhodopirellula aestuarii]|uniref:Phenylacetate--CoA ligase family protein n=1 Tax=Aporhodopirellula aestuarii TaxID=2950107 RepID=A0ABT0U8X3_9BACT|nr:phenylacetate--CoA ligase family protein [Aporhodopirellula aestuarii]MCM2373365.1 phenylacetate--CoA ligase family protein [Aporhodopirellula aestuarii]
MPTTTRPQCREMNRDDLSRLQLKKLNRLLASLSNHPLYAKSLAAHELPLTRLDELSSFPLLNKSDLLGKHPGDPALLFHLDKNHYRRFHQTSGSRGWPMPVLDTADDWAWWLVCWQYVLDAAEVTCDDVAMMAFSFGPFIGFWSANDALVERGVLVVPGGGLSSLARLKLIEQQRCTVLCCTPTYALHLASVATEHGVDLSRNSVTRIIVAGEPGGSVPAVRAAIESQWHARVVDHAGASELGAWGFASSDDSGLHVTESEFIAEFLVFDEASGSHRPAQEGETSELVMTNLGRHGGPVIRYRTGDIVRPRWNHDLPCRFVHLPGGVLGRADDMLVIRGVNVFPSSIEAIVREVSPSAEFRMIATRQDEMDQIRIEIEKTPESSEGHAEQSSAVVTALEELMRERLTLRVPVSLVEYGSLPRSEGKSRRWVDQRPQKLS